MMDWKKSLLYNQQSVIFIVAAQNFQFFLRLLVYVSMVKHSMVVYLDYTFFKNSTSARVIVTKEKAMDSFGAEFLCHIYIGFGISPN